MSDIKAIEKQISSLTEELNKRKTELLSELRKQYPHVYVVKVKDFGSMGNKHKYDYAFCSSFQKATELWKQYSGSRATHKIEVQDSSSLSLDTLQKIDTLSYGTSGYVSD